MATEARVAVQSRGLLFPHPACYCHLTLFATAPSCPLTLFCYCPLTLPATAPFLPTVHAGITQRQHLPQHPPQRQGEAGRARWRRCL